MFRQYNNELIEGSSEKVNRTHLKDKDDAALNIVYCFNLSVYHRTIFVALSHFCVALFHLAPKKL
jgi:hypothetical protein